SAPPAGGARPPQNPFFPRPQKASAKAAPMPVEAPVTTTVMDDGRLDITEVARDMRDWRERRDAEPGRSEGFGKIRYVAHLAFLANLARHQARVSRLPIDQP